ncbi:OB-fold nucleic acid binding domain-containing protein [Janibacter corallicola]|uniref:OB-fold nucleic acid binding domain-containing protein n=1 Tax=Janibacter corallicola TaxID=415212 RepID=UPI00082BAC52|nr:OB-fold nucleic acid binding domain-containing protein [Janibacter corallicola]
MVGLLRRLVDLGRSDDDIEAGELRAAAQTHGGTPATGHVDRQVITVAGSIASVTLRPRATVPALVAEVYDGSATVQLVWLGRRRIRGIDPGAYLKATGLLCHPGAVPTIYNPAYELVPRHEH